MCARLLLGCGQFTDEVLTSSCRGAGSLAALTHVCSGPKQGRQPGCVYMYVLRAEAGLLRAHVGLLKFGSLPAPPHSYLASRPTVCPAVIMHCFCPAQSLPLLTLCMQTLTVS